MTVPEHVLWLECQNQIGSGVAINQMYGRIDGSKNISYSGNCCPGCFIYGMEQQKQVGMKSSKA